MLFISITLPILIQSHACPASVSPKIFWFHPMTSSDLVLWGLHLTKAVTRKYLCYLKEEHIRNFLKYDYLFSLNFFEICQNQFQNTDNVSVLINQGNLGNAQKTISLWPVLMNLCKCKIGKHDFNSSEDSHRSFKRCPHFAAFCFVSIGMLSFQCENPTSCFHTILMNAFRLIARRNFQRTFHSK